MHSNLHFSRAPQASPSRCPIFQLCGAILGNIPNSGARPSHLPSFMYVLLRCYMKIKVMGRHLPSNCIIIDCFASMCPYHGQVPLPNEEATSPRHIVAKRLCVLAESWHVTLRGSQFRCFSDELLVACRRDTALTVRRSTYSSDDLFAVANSVKFLRDRTSVSKDSAGIKHITDQSTMIAVTASPHVSIASSVS